MPTIALPGSDVVDSDAWWVRRLSKAIHDRNRGAGWNRAALSNKAGTRPGLSLLDGWLRSEPPLPVGADEGYVAAWQHFLRTSRTNYAELVVSSRTERIVALGWRTGVTDGDDTDGDQVAESLAVHTDLRNRVSEAVQDMCGLSVGYLMVGPDEQERGKAIVTRESPLSTIVASDYAGRPRAGLRMVVDDWTGEHEIWLYRPAVNGAPGYQRVARKSRTGWEWGEPQTLPRFPIVELGNYLGVGEFERHLDVLTRINDTMFTRMVLTKLQAHRQRAIEQAMPKDGDAHKVDIEVDPADFISGPDALWLMPPGTKLWESAQADLSAIRSMTEDDVKALSATTKTPIWQLLPGSQNQSATGSERANEGFLALIEDRRHRVDVGLSKVLSMCFDIMGDSGRSDAAKIRTIWAPVERYSITEKSQAFSSLYGKVPFDELALDVLQKRPSDLARLNAGRGRDLFFQAPGGSAVSGVDRA